MALLVVRHGRTEANASGLLLGRADPELDSHGRRQAKAIAESLSLSDPAVFTSPLKRCVQTASAIAAKAVVDDRLVELDYGQFDLKPLSSIPSEVWTAWRGDPDFRPPGGETLNELQTRVESVLESLREMAAERDVVIVTHVSPIKAAVAWALGVQCDIAWRCFVAQASITRISTSGSLPSLQAFNMVDHLSEP